MPNVNTDDWGRYETLPMEVRAMQLEDLDRDCPYPLGYDLHRRACAELPGGAVPVKAGDWLVEFSPGNVGVVSDGAFAGMCDPKAVRDADLPQLRAIEGHVSSREEAAPSVSTKKLSKAEMKAGLDLKPRSGGIDSASGASTLNEPT